MTIAEIIDRVDRNVPNAFSGAEKVRWIAQLDGRIAADVMLMSPAEIRQLGYRYPEDKNTEPLVEFPHDDIYELWLEAQIHYHNGETNKYQNTIQLYNASYGGFVRWFASNFEPAQGYGRREIDGAF